MKQLILIAILLLSTNAYADHWTDHLIDKYKTEGDARIFHYIGKTAKDNAQLDMAKFYEGEITLKEFYTSLLIGTVKEYITALNKTGLVKIPPDAYLDYQPFVLETLKGLNDTIGLTPKKLEDKDVEKMCTVRSLLWYKFLDQVHTDYGLSTDKHWIMFTTNTEKEASIADKDTYVLTPTDNIYYNNLIK